MGVERYEDLVCWQLSNDLKVKVYALLDSTNAKRDFDFRNQIKDSAASAPANISEAFGYYSHPDSARFARFARASLIETHNHLRDGIDRGFWTIDTVAALLDLAERARKATTGWIIYLQTTETPKSSRKRKRGRRT